MEDFFGSFIFETVVRAIRPAFSWLCYRIRYPNKWQRAHAKKLAVEQPPVIVTIFRWIFLISIGDIVGLFALCLYRSN